MQHWQKALAAAAAALAVAATLYLILSDEAEAGRAGSTEEEERQRGDRGADGSRQEPTREELLRIMQEMLEDQQQMKAKMKVVAQEISARRLSLREVYQLVRERVAADSEQPVIAKHGLSVDSLDAALAKYQQDPVIAQALELLMTGGMSGPSTAAVSMTPETLTKIHAYMLEEMKAFVAEYGAIPERERQQLDTKAVVLASQAVLDARVTEKFRVQSEDIEQALMMNHARVQTPEFARIHMEMQQAMQALMPPGSMEGGPLG